MAVAKEVVCASHTPGPWRIAFGARDCDDYFAIGGQGRQAVCDFSLANHAEQMSHGEMVANAHLIAASPELLAVCQYIVNHPMSFPKYAVDMAQAAIDKATGKPTP